MGSGLQGLTRIVYAAQARAAMRVNEALLARAVGAAEAWARAGVAGTLFGERLARAALADATGAARIGALLAAFRRGAALLGFVADLIHGAVALQAWRCRLANPAGDATLARRAVCITDAPAGASAVAETGAIGARGVQGDEHAGEITADVALGAFRRGALGVALRSETRAAAAQVGRARAAAGLLDLASLERLTRALGRAELASWTLAAVETCHAAAASIAQAGPNRAGGPGFDLHTRKTLAQAAFGATHGGTLRGARRVEAHARAVTERRLRGAASGLAPRDCRAHAAAAGLTGATVVVGQALGAAARGAAQRGLRRAGRGRAGTAGERVVLGDAQTPAATGLVGGAATAAVDAGQPSRTLAAAVGKRGALFAARRAILAGEASAAVRVRSAGRSGRQQALIDAKAARVPAAASLLIHLVDATSGVAADLAGAIARTVATLAGCARNPRRRRR